ncbi:hypothetical protein MFIFM68171_07602 [Madurella fahalii]|uniref:Uncharacterized protein n=1 Tax=Madurella fahalii TaxID=1157608 RepID=A0ABQ0GHZ5_9PEZI
MNTENVQPQPPGGQLPMGPPIQSWTVDGYPIVDGKYLDLSTGEIKTHEGLLTGGPPSLAVYWHNKLPKHQEQPFYAVSAFSQISVTDYLTRIGDLLRTGICTVDSLNATKYSVNLVILTQLSRNEFEEALLRHGLLYSGSNS